MSDRYRFMSKYDFQRRMRRRRLQRLSRHIPTILFLLFLAVILCAGGFILLRLTAGRFSGTPDASSVSAETSANSSQAASPEEAPSLWERIFSRRPAPSGTERTQAADAIAARIAQADRAALGYDYDKALALLSDSGLDSSDPRIADAISRYTAQKEALVPANVKQTTHIFFHSLIMDPAKAFDGDSKSESYNSVMTTKNEFLAILDRLYADGYVLVRLHDVAAPASAENGDSPFQWGSILLPEGKKPRVMSQDDVCYNSYMDGDGFARRVGVGADGKPACEMQMDDGSSSVGAYDLIPLLEDFIQQHPDFSYKGARAIIALTGYEGILGYRTASSYRASPTYEADRQAAAQVVQCLKDNGWEIASHSWGHLHLGVSSDTDPSAGYAISEERFMADADKWQAEVEPLTGPTDIMIFPYGDDISDWHSYSQEDSRFRYLRSKGFRYFCNVDASRPYWMQMGPNYFRMARRNLDGYRLYEDMIQTDPAKKRLSDLFDAAEIFDPARPTPVSWSY